ncbi:MAG: tRNA (N6-isopentenyl adenosine(37)-C2)-methylthiotransferase MiaB [Caulobacterales bacterium]|nr:tRNA (N6-isopentenyl adenosine(37)-C2)-methylthiotransferase MiaB [Caulobacterales bacterium]
MTDEPSSGATRKRLYVKTYGCQMNVYDSERMRDVLAPLGYEAADAPDAADLVILNTCHIREKAAEKVYSELGRLRALKEARAAAGGRMTIAVAGCVAQAEGAEILRRAPTVDLVLGPQAIHKLPEMVARASRAAGEPLAVEFDVDDKFDALPEARRVDGPAAFLTVQEGCDKFCTFCVVPYTRGAEWSRPVDQIVAEARALARAGVREVTLLGQNVNAYRAAAPAGEGGDPWGLARLVRHLARIDGLERLRFTTSHPRDMDADLIAAFADEPKLMPYLHLPLQAGSDRVLAAMNRRHTLAEYLAIIARVREARPDIALSGDFIVGFPGESDADFEATLEAVRAVGYAQAFSFKFSRRPGTPASELGAHVPEEVKSERLARLQALLDDQQRAFNASQIGRRLPVLFDKPGKGPGQLAGRTPYLQAVHVDAPLDRLGAVAEVDIEAATRNSLAGRLAAAAEEAA